MYPRPLFAKAEYRKIILTTARIQDVGRTIIEHLRSVGCLNDQDSVILPGDQISQHDDKHGFRGYPGVLQQCRLFQAQRIVRRCANPVASDHRTDSCRGIRALLRIDPVHLCAIVLTHCTDTCSGDSYWLRIGAEPAHGGRGHHTIAGPTARSESGTESPFTLCSSLFLLAMPLPNTISLLST